MDVRLNCVLLSFNYSFRCYLCNKRVYCGMYALIGKIIPSFLAINFLILKIYDLNIYIYAWFLYKILIFYKANRFCTIFAWLPTKSKSLFSGSVLHSQTRPRIAQVAVSRGLYRGNLNASNLGKTSHAERMFCCFTLRGLYRRSLRLFFLHAKAKRGGKMGNESKTQTA